MILLILFCLVNSVLSQEMIGQGFKKSNLSCYEILEESSIFKTKIECFGFCMTQELCQGVLFNGEVCKTMKHVVATRLGSVEGWVLKEFAPKSTTSK